MIEHDQRTTARATPGQISRALLNTVLMTVGFATAVNVPAWVWNWWRGWVLVGLFFLVHVVGTLRIIRANPDLLRERARVGRHVGQPISDKVLVYAFTAGYSGTLVVATVDAARWHIWPALPSAATWAGLAMFAAGWVLVLRALETNAFAVRVVRHQPERGHRLVDVDVYRVVRHPMYAGLCAVMIGVPVWVGSTLGLLLAIVPIGLLAVRIVFEERMLREAVAGYREYTQRVRKRLVPGVW